MEDSGCHTRLLGLHGATGMACERRNLLNAGRFEWHRTSTVPGLGQLTSLLSCGPGTRTATSESWKDGYNAAQVRLITVVAISGGSTAVEGNLRAGSRFVPAATSTVEESGGWVIHRPVESLLCHVEACDIWLVAVGVGQISPPYLRREAWEPPGEDQWLLDRHLGNQGGSQCADATA
jgi:hypothetical protein